ncbi:MAG: 50S ribosomal protein L21, partial [Pseudomonadota bacterium]
MYAIIESGGKQYRIKEGQKLQVEKLVGAPGESVVIDKVLLVATDDGIVVGQPYVSNYRVNTEILRHGRGEKITIIKFKRRKHHMKRQGHRQ